MRRTRHVVMFSGGMSSAYLAKWVINEYGHDSTILFFTDTKWEDEDNYRFMKDVSEYLCKEITYYQDGRTPEDIFWQKRFLGNFGTAPCSRELKMKQTVIFVERLRASGYEPILYFGIGAHEASRSNRIAELYSHHCLEPVESRFPLIELNMDNAKLATLIEEEWGIKVPRMYKLGFTHANCGGRCVKGGIKHYANLYRVWPERYMAQEDMEERFCKEINRYTLLKRRGQSFPLKELRESLEREVQLNLDETIEQIPCTCIF